MRGEDPLAQMLLSVLEQGQAPVLESEALLDRVPTQSFPPLAILAAMLVLRETRDSIAPHRIESQHVGRTRWRRCS